MSLSEEYKEYARDLLANPDAMVSKLKDSLGYMHMYYQTPTRTFAVTLDHQGRFFKYIKSITYN